MRKRILLLYCITLLGFLLGIHNGKIALWAGNDPEPVRVFPYSAELLPEKDRQLLEKGIRIDDRAQLTRYLEDLMS